MRSARTLPVVLEGLFEFGFVFLRLVVPDVFERRLVVFLVEFRVRGGTWIFVTITTRLTLATAVTALLCVFGLLSDLNIKNNRHYHRSAA